MLPKEVINAVNELETFERVLLIEYLYETLTENEDKEILGLWIEESKDRLHAVNKGQLGLVEYTDIKAQII